MSGWRALVTPLAILLLVAPLGAQEAEEGAETKAKEAAIAEAMSAAPEALAENATILDWEGNVLREGTNEYTCFPTPPGFAGEAPMCLDGPWMKWAEAWQNKADLTIEEPGIAFMLGGDTGASNTDPYATDPDAVDDWVDANDHLMLLLSDPAAYDALPTDPSYGGPWVMWKGTPYVHVMIPTGEVEYEGEAVSGN